MTKELIAALEECRLSAAEFDHRAHVQAGFGYLQRLGYAGALAAMAKGLRRFAAHHGKQGLYHETITAAFLALIHERMAEDLVEQRTVIDVAGARQLEWERFAARHPDLFAPDLLSGYYAKEMLRSELARNCFVLPKAGRALPSPVTLGGV
jgi:hypothetical protein